MSTSSTTILAATTASRAEEEQLHTVNRIPIRLPPNSKSIWKDSFLARPIELKVVPPKVRLIIIGGMVSIAGLLYGLDTGSIGPITEMESFYQTIGFIPSPALHGFFVASILLSASISSLCSGYIADKISRRFGILSGSIIFAIGTIISATSHSFATLIVSRLITGIGAGQTISVASIYLIEIATSDVRGKLACMIQFNIAIGIMVGYFITYGSQNIPSSLSWRLPFMIQASFASFLAILILAFVPFSPRWQAQHHGEQAALKTLRGLRMSSNNNNPALDTIQEQKVYKEMEEIKKALLQSQSIGQSFTASSSRSSAGKGNYKELFHKRYRARTILGISMLTFQQLSGVDVLLYFAPVVFSSIFSSQTASFLASGVSGIVLVVSTIPAQIYVDRWGRKPMMVGGGLLMAFCFLIIGSLFAKFASVQNGSVRLSSHGPERWIIVILIYLFLATFSMTWAVVCRIYAAEIMPTRLRSKAAAAQQLANWITNFTIALVAPSFLKATPSGPYFFFSACLFIATAVCHFFMYETKNRSLEEIDQLFDDRAS